MEKEITKNNNKTKSQIILEDLLLYLKSNASRLAKDLGYTSNVKIQHIKSGRNNISVDIANDIVSKFPEINYDWLLTGEGSMLKGSSEGVNPDEVINYESGKPYYDVDFINGFSNVTEITHSNPEYLINYPPANNCDFWVNATGESMQGVVNNGDKIAIKEVDKEWFPLGEVYAIVTTNGHRMIKTITKSEDKECYKLVSANPDKGKFPDQDIPKGMIQNIFKVICVIRFVN